MRHWGSPHVHCPGCGADSPVPAPEVDLRCFTCGVHWLSVELSGDEEADWQRVREHIAAEPEGWTVTWRPLLIDSPLAPKGSIGVPLNSAFLYRSSN
jgi:hypothetical protein